MSPIRYKRWCQAGDHEVSFPEIVKGYEVSTDNYVVMEDSDLDNLPLPTTRSIEISEFVPEGGIEGGLYFKSAYYMEPEETGRKAYHLLRQALADTGMVAIAKIAFRDREHLSALQPADGLLLMNTLHWPDEIRSTEDLDVPEDVRVSPAELKMAENLVGMMATKFEPSEYKDEYKQAVLKLVEAKVQKKEIIEAPEPEAETTVVDLMSALKASVEKAKKSGAKTKAASAGSSSRTATRTVYYSVLSPRFRPDSMLRRPRSRRYPLCSIGRQPMRS